MGLGLLWAVGAACGDDPKTGTVDSNSDNPCGDACPVEECRFGTCIGANNANNDAGGDADTGTPDADTGDDVADTDIPDKTCDGDDACEDDEYCFFAEGNADGVCQEGCREGGCRNGEACDPTSRECVDGCFGDADCDDDETCALPEGGGVGECAEVCADDDDCGRDEICLDSACVEGCREDNDCDGDLVCLGNACVEDTCATDEDCPTGFYCDGDTQSCEEGCRTDEECPDGETCIENVCSATACEEDAECPPDQYCNGSACVDGCRDDVSCGPGNICEERACREGCREDSVCDVGEFCDTEEFACETGCREDAECAVGESCQRTEVSRNEFSQRCLPSICAMDTECPDEFYCALGGRPEGQCNEGCRQGECEGELVCDPDLRQCVPPTCDDSEQCPEGTYCDLDGTEQCVPGCDGDDRCVGQPCDEETNTCGCAEDLDCPNNQICFQNMCIQPCDEDDDCGQGRYCEVETGLCIEGCRDDINEPNNSPAEAGRLSPGSYPNLRMCYEAAQGQDDRDCYAVPLDAGATMRVTVQVNGLALGLRVYDPDNNQVATSERPTGDESANYTATTSGNHSFCVIPEGSAFEGDYGVGLVVDEPIVCNDDEGENPSDDTCLEVQARPLQLTVNTRQSFTDRTICGNDNDHFAVRMQAGQQLDIEYDPADALLDVEVTGDDCTTVLARAANGEASFVAVADGLYTVRVYSDLPSAAITYDLGLTLLAGEAQCREDFLGNTPIESNNDAAQSTLLSSFGLQRSQILPLNNLALCEGDEDWYQIPVQVANDFIRVTLTQNDTLQPLTLEILGSNGSTVLDSANEDATSKTAETMPLTAGTYYVRVRSAAAIPEAGVDYNLQVLVNPTSGCAPDAFEPNDSAAMATLTDDGTFQGQLCRNSNDADWYRFQFTGGERVQLRMVYDHGSAFLLSTFGKGPTQDGDTNGDGQPDGAEFLFPNGEFTEDTLSSTLIITPARRGEWFLKVERDAEGDPVDYTLEVEIERPDCGPADEAIANESCANARSLLSGQSASDQVCGPTGDQDWYSVTVASGETLYVDVSYLHFDGNLGLVVQGPSGAEVGRSDNSGPNCERLRIEPTMSGTYCVQVFTTSPLTVNRYTVSPYLGEAQPLPGCD